MTKRLIFAALLAVVTITLYLVGLKKAQTPVADDKIETPSGETKHASEVNPAREPAVENSSRSPVQVSPSAPGTPAPGEVMPPKQTPPDSEELPPSDEKEDALSEVDPVQDIEEVRRMVRGFRDALGENPVGTNEEITRALTGGNLKQVKMPVPRGSKVSEVGELVDRWGTPYFFHQLSAEDMEVRSAGPDRVMWTADDQQIN